MSRGENIVYFDGVCGLCNKFISFLLWADRKKNVLMFATLQGAKAKDLKLDNENLLGSIVYQKDGQVFLKSSAVLKILKEIGGVWNLLLVTYLIPRFVRDWIYDIIANNRYTFFGKNDSCRMPTIEERKKFIMG